MCRRKADICGLQEGKQGGACGRLVEGKDSRYQIIWVGNDKDMSGVAMLLAGKWVKAIFGVNRVSDSIMFMKLTVGRFVTVLSVYAPQAGLDDCVKDLFYENLQWTLTKLMLLRSYLFLRISMVIL